jgi:hypothetical protein
MHALRHFYASALLDAGESIKALSSYLGHADAGFTLQIYRHLTSNSEDRTRRGIDDLFALSDGLAGKLVPPFPCEMAADQRICAVDDGRWRSVLAIF